MASKYSVKLKTIAEEHDLIVVNKATDYETALVTTADINRPAMQLTGFYNYFDPKRIQIIGRVESTYLDTLTSEQRFQAWETFMQYDIAGLVICHGVPAFPECLAMAQRYNRTVFITEQDTSQFQAELIDTLQRYLAPRITMHGVLVEVYGEGILILGDSGVGKSETAIELVKRGHRLIADDAVDIRKVSATTLVGSAPEIIRHYVELRGIGIIDVRRIFGMGAVKDTEKIDMIINLEPWVQGKMYDRLGLDQETTDIMGIEVPTTTIPVRPGRNLAIIMEIAAMNNRQKKMGYNTAEEFNRRLMAQMGVEE